MFHNGFQYENNGIKNGTPYYKCSKKNEYFCSGTAKKMSDGSIITMKPHTNHPPQGNQRSLFDEFKNILKTRAKEENSTIKNIYDEEARRYPVAAGGYPFSTAKPLMQLARKSSLPCLPVNLPGLATLFEDNLLNRYNCCDHIFFKSCVRDIDGKSSSIFACTTLIRQVLNSDVEEIHADATFKVVPANMGYQMLGIHAMIQNYSIPIVLVLMESKTRNSYESVFNYIKHNLLPDIAPQVVITDYETALRDVLQSHFPTARISGCWFHHTQAVYKNMKSKGYYSLVKRNDSAMKALKLLFSLPLLPARDIERGFQLIKAFAIHHGVPMENLFTYYQRYWLQNVGPHIISVYNLPRRTNNNIESFHNQLRIKFSVTHPNLWVFLGHLRNMFQNYQISVQQISNGLQPTRNLKAKYLLNSKKIRTATTQYDAGVLSTWQFLHVASYSTSTYLNRQVNWIGEDEEYEEAIIDGFDDDFDDHPELQVPTDRPNIIQNVSTCMVCMVNNSANSIQHIVLPCGHAWICEECITNQRCLLCRMNDITFQRMFFN